MNHQEALRTGKEKKERDMFSGSAITEKCPGLKKALLEDTQCNMSDSGPQTTEEWKPTMLIICTIVSCVSLLYTSILAREAVGTNDFEQSRKAT